MKTLLFLPIVLYLLACNNQPKKVERKDGFTKVLKTREDSLYYDVMKGHDIGMAKMNVLRNQQKRVERELDSINKLGGGRANQGYKTALVGLKEDLSYADHAMFTWMQEFNADSAKEDKEKRLAYLESEKTKVEKVKQNILNSLNRADSLFK